MGGLLQIRGLRKTFGEEAAPVRAVRSVDLIVEEGEFVAVTGPSGCGKSTLLHLIAGLQRPDAGGLVLAGESLVGRSEDDLARMRRRHIGIVFQFFNLLDGMTALENVLLAGLIAGMAQADAERRSRDLLDLLGLGGREGALPAVLSGGERQRVAVARALVHRPTLLLADEPTGALDSDGAAEIVELFGGLHGAGQTIVLVSHDAEVAAGAQRIVTMRDGRIGEPVLETAFVLETP
jgi:putative ABC transport system ATP-binding protein